MLKDLREFAEKVKAEIKNVDFSHSDEAARDLKLNARAYVFGYEDFKNSKQALEYLVNTLNYGFEKMHSFKMAVMREKARLILAEAAYGILLLMIDSRQSSAADAEPENLTERG